MAVLVFGHQVAPEVEVVPTGGAVGHPAGDDVDPGVLAGHRVSLPAGAGVVADVGLPRGQHGQDLDALGERHEGRVESEVAAFAEGGVFLVPSDDRRRVTWNINNRTS